MCVLPMKDFQLGSDMCWGWGVLYILVSHSDHQGSQIRRILDIFDILVVNRQKMMILFQVI